MSNTINNSMDYTSLFSSLPQTNSSSGSGLVGLATEFSSIRSGSYKKLVSAYYKKLGSEGTTEAVEKENKNLQLVAGNANSLKSAATELKKTDFATASEEEALGAVKKFVSAYNSVIDTADDVDRKGVLRNTVWMTNMMQKSAGLLSDAGITIGDDNKLTLNEAKWKEAGMSVKTTLFSGNNSLAEKLTYKATQITGAAGETYSNTASAYKPDGDYTKPSTSAMYETLM
ncbi:MAG: hypothetical protein ACI4FZ_12835 [Lachnospiraceae bacterium]